MPISPRAGQRRLAAPEPVVRQLGPRRLLERRHVHALRVEPAHDVPDRAVLAGRVHRLEDDQQRPAVLGIEALLQLAETLDVLRAPLGRRLLSTPAVSPGSCSESSNPSVARGSVPRNPCGHDTACPTADVPERCDARDSREPVDSGVAPLSDLSMRKARPRHGGPHRRAGLPGRRARRQQRRLRGRTGRRGQPSARRGSGRRQLRLRHRAAQRGGQVRRPPQWRRRLWVDGVVPLTAAAFRTACDRLRSARTSTRSWPSTSPMGRRF